MNVNVLQFSGRGIDNSTDDGESSDNKYRAYVITFWQKVSSEAIYALVWETSKNAAFLRAAEEVCMPGIYEHTICEAIPLDVLRSNRSSYRTIIDLPEGVPEDRKILPEWEFI